MWFSSFVCLFVHFPQVLVLKNYTICFDLSSFHWIWFGLCMRCGCPPPCNHCSKQSDNQSQTRPSLICGDDRHSTSSEANVQFCWLKSCYWFLSHIAVASKKSSHKHEDNICHCFLVSLHGRPRLKLIFISFSHHQSSYFMNISPWAVYKAWWI